MPSLLTTIRQGLPTSRNPRSRIGSRRCTAVGTRTFASVDIQPGPKRHRRLAETPYTTAKHSGHSISIMRSTATFYPPTLTSSAAPKNRRRLLQTPCRSVKWRGQSISSPVTVHSISLCPATTLPLSVTPETRLQPTAMLYMVIKYSSDVSHHFVVEKSLTRPAPLELPSARARHRHWVVSPLGGRLASWISCTKR